MKDDIHYFIILYDFITFLLRISKLLYYFKMIDFVKSDEL